MVHSDTELAKAEISAFSPIFHKFSLEKGKVGFGTGPVLVVAENEMLPASAECLRSEGKERDKCWIVLSPWAGQEWLELLLWLPASHKSHFCIPAGIGRAGAQQPLPPLI